MEDGPNPEDPRAGPLCPLWKVPGGVKSRLAVFHRTCRNTTLTEPSEEIFGVVR